MTHTIFIDDLSGEDIRALLQFHLDEAHKYSPAESVHALDLDALRAPDVTFWTVRGGDGGLMGCGALKTLTPTHGEIKSMRTAPEHIRKGVGAAMLQLIIDTASARGMSRLSLETGTMDSYLPARRLYERFGFVPCPPFGDYWDDPLSMCMTREV